MLGKLIKHEWKDTYKVGCVMLGIVAIVTLIGCIALSTPVMKALIAESDSNLTGGQIFGVFSFIGTMVLYAIMLIGASYGILIYLGVHFHKSMYSAEGYLTHTLPVKGHELLGSKLLVGGIWYFIIELSVVVSVIALMVAMITGMLHGIDPDLSMELFWKEMQEMFTQMFDMNVTAYLVVVIISVLVSPFASVMVLYGSLTIGQLSGKHKGVMGIVTYFVVMLVQLLVNWIVQTIYTATVTLQLIESGDEKASFMTLNTEMLLQLAMQVAFAVAMYFVAHYIMTKKLNLE